MGNFSKFVRPGWQRIGVTGSGTPLVSAYKYSDGSFAIVAINPGSAQRTTFSLSGLGAASVTPWVTSPSLSLVAQTAVSVSGSSFTSTLPATSVTTFYHSTTVNGACGSANGQGFSTAPTSNLCSAGTASGIKGTGPWTWTCTGSNGGTTASCSANLDGACGSANGESFLKAPTSNLCSAGKASKVTGKGPWHWTCAGSNGGTTVSCSANLK